MMSTQLIAAEVERLAHAYLFGKTEVQGGLNKNQLLDFVIRFQLAQADIASTLNRDELCKLIITQVPSDQLIVRSDPAPDEGPGQPADIGGYIMPSNIVETPTITLATMKTISYEQFESRFRELKNVGSGSFGAIYKAQDLELGKTVALKQIDTRSTNINDLKEITLLQYLSNKFCHPNVLCYIDHFIVKLGPIQTMHIETEFIDGINVGNLAWKKDSALQYAPSIEACRITRGTLKGMSFLHSNDVCHLDISAQNIMVRTNGEPVIIDLGFGCLKEDCAAILGGQYSYMAPERLLCVSDITKCSLHEKKTGDVWALGIVFVQAFTRLGPDLDHIMIDLSIASSHRTEKTMHEFVFVSLKQLVASTKMGCFYPPDAGVNSVIENILFNVDYKTRPTAADLLHTLECNTI